MAKYSSKKFSPRLKAQPQYIRYKRTDGRTTTMPVARLLLWCDRLKGNCQKTYRMQ